MLAQSIKVLDYIGFIDDEYLYGQLDEDTDEWVPILTLTKVYFEDFGKVEKLTITIRPGDELN